MLGTKYIKRIVGQTTGVTLTRNGLLSQNNKKEITAFDYPKTEQLHITARQYYPQAELLPLPANVDPAESTRFSPQRTRDINSTAILSHLSSFGSNWNNIDITVDQSVASDPHVESYDCYGAVSLNSSMQSNVPSPFGGMHRFTHLNMPGGQWSQDSKFMSNDLNASHYINLRQSVRRAWSKFTKNQENQGSTIHLQLKLKNGNCLNVKQNITNACVCFSWHDSRYNTFLNHTTYKSSRLYSTSTTSKKDNLNGSEMDTSIINIAEKKTDGEELSRRDKLKKAIKEYGSTVIIFHVGISLVSLGAFYMLVSSGVDVIKILGHIGWETTTLSNQFTAGAGTFVVAYAIHKIFAPIRISITLTATPFIVRYLRKKGILKSLPK